MWTLINQNCRKYRTHFFFKVYSTWYISVSWITKSKMDRSLSANKKFALPPRLFHQGNFWTNMKNDILPTGSWNLVNFDSQTQFTVSKVGWILTIFFHKYQSGSTSFPKQSSNHGRSSFYCVLLLGKCIKTLPTMVRTLKM